jgi:murein DD-endopeptidase MepM/ murein hydrolase activator NlpD
MNDLKLFKYFLFGGILLVPTLLFFVVLISNQSASGDESVVVVANEDFSIPFENSNLFSVTSSFGYRLDPFGSSETKFHSGMDLGAPAGTDVVASADGIVYEVGYSATGLGNYVYIEHQTGDGVLYTAYGHMLDDSIVVEKDQPIMKGQKIGEVGSTGASTGYHLHFMIMKNKISFKSEDLIDPYFVIYGLN